jgi:exosortase
MVALASQQKERSPVVAELVARAPLIIGALALAIPTLVRLGEQVWSMEIGAHGPIVLATGAWLLWRKWRPMVAAAKPGHRLLTIGAAVASLALYIFGRAYDFISLEAGGLYGFLLTMLYGRVGLKAMLANWFPLFYLGLLLPVPGWVIDEFTAPLKLLVSFLATSAVEPLGIPIVREGVTMTVGAYQLLVEDACSGLNSLIGLIAITLFYIYLLRNASPRYAAFLVLLIVPIAIAANVLRIITLILLTYYFGDAVGQGFLHMTAGMVLFAISLMLMFGIDSAVSGLVHRWRGRTA